MLKKQESLRDCVKIIMSDEFKLAGDGTSRGMFILVNELKRIFGNETALTIINDWNAKMGNPISQNDIMYRMKLKNYSLNCDYIHNFLEGIGIDMDKKCKGKVFK